MLFGKIYKQRIAAGVYVNNPLAAMQEAVGLVFWPLYVIYGTVKGFMIGWNLDKTHRKATGKALTIAEVKKLINDDLNKL